MSKDKKLEKKGTAVSECVVQEPEKAHRDKHSFEAGHCASMESISDNDVRISVITVVFNGERYLEYTIESVINQTYPNIEYIVIDGGSEDGTLDIIRKYSDHIDYWVSEPDSGIYNAMNKGIFEAKGDVIGILNADDFYDLRACENVARAFDRERDVFLVHGAMNILNEKSEIVSTYGSKRSMNELLVAPYSHPTCFIRREFYETYGMFDEAFSTAADYDLMLRFINSGLKEYYVDCVLANFRRVGVTSQSRMFPVKQLWGLMRKQNYSLSQRIWAIFFRYVRFFLVFTLDSCGLTKLKKKVRSMMPYKKGS